MEPHRTSTNSGQKYVDELIGASNPTRLYEVASVKWATFMLLVNKLEQHGLALVKVTTMDKAIIAWYILSGSSNRAVEESFQHSGDTICHVFVEVLNALGAFVARAPLGSGRPTAGVSMSIRKSNRSQP